MVNLHQLDWPGGVLFLPKRRCGVGGGGAAGVTPSPLCAAAPAPGAAAEARGVPGWAAQRRRRASQSGQACAVEGQAAAAAALRVGWLDNTMPREGKQLAGSHGELVKRLTCVQVAMHGSQEPGQDHSRTLPRPGAACVWCDVYVLLAPGPTRQPQAGQPALPSCCTAGAAGCRMHACVALRQDRPQPSWASRTSL